MPVRESEAIILRSYALGEADRLVSFLSRNEGRIRGVAAGARKPKSRFGASLEPLSYVRMWYYERETRPLVRISQCEILESFVIAQRSYNAIAAFGLMSEIAENVLPEHEPSDPVFRLLLATSRAISTSGLIALPIGYFTLWTVRLGGWLPSLDRCGTCGRDLAGQGAWVNAEGGVFCRDCRPGGARALSAEALATAHRMLRESVEKLAAAGGPRVPPELTNYLMDLIEQHMEKKLSVRPILELAP
ncbi:MAG: DNA repair protein RecO [Acidobacteriota bacterium]|nr:DNA repair protein RecO [Acidobacteriota bacterium]